MAISKTIRFEVFKRDGFRCQYCGKTPPEVTLEVDHINPVSHGGKDDLNNLITSCFDCNRGKKNVPLTRIPNTLAANVEILNEREMQLKEYNKVIQRIEKRIQQDAEKVNAVYSKHFPEWELSELFINQSLKPFLKKLPFQEVIGAMEKACLFIKSRNRSSNSAAAISYFCGICWSKLRRDREV